MRSGDTAALKKDAAISPRSWRVLVVSHYFDTHRGGVEIVAGRLAREFLAMGVDVAWAASGAAPELPGAAVIKLPAWNVTERRLGFPNPIIGPRAISRLWRAIWSTDLVLVHDGLYLTSIVALLIAQTMRRPVILVQHIGEVPYRSVVLRALMVAANATLARWALRTADQVVFISGFVHDYFRNVRYRRAPRIIFNAVDTELFRPARFAERAVLRRKFGLPDGPVALFVGRFVEKKGLAIVRLVAQMTPDVTWVLAGWGTINPDEWGLPNVRVMQGLDHGQLAPLYRAADVFVLPSQGEGFPLVIQEALASGLPVICGAEILGADNAAAGHLRAVRLDRLLSKDAATNVYHAVKSALADTHSDRPAERAQLAKARYSREASRAAYLDIMRSLVMERSR